MNYSITSSNGKRMWILCIIAIVLVLGISGCTSNNTNLSPPSSSGTTISTADFAALCKTVTNSAEIESVLGRKILGSSQLDSTSKSKPAPCMFVYSQDAADKNRPVLTVTGQLVECIEGATCQDAKKQQNIFDTVDSKVKPNVVPQSVQFGTYGTGQYREEVDITNHKIGWVHLAIKDRYVLSVWITATTDKAIDIQSVVQKTVLLIAPKLQ